MGIENRKQVKHISAAYTLHISSTNTVGEVIEALLKKFLVTESPTKFALYKRCHREDQGTMLKMKMVPAFVSLF